MAHANAELFGWHLWGRTMVVVAVAVVFGGRDFKAGENDMNPATANVASSHLAEPMLDWLSESLTGKPRLGRRGRIDLEVVRQDHSVLGYGQSCIDTPIRIGSQPFAHGLGTHANSEIRVSVPPGAVAFDAMVGIDNNHDTQGIRGSVIFSITSKGSEQARTDVLHGGAEPVRVHIDLSPETQELILLTDTTTDGPGYDQADWADARFVMADGSSRYLDENQSPLLFLTSRPPFSFVYEGRASADLLADWEHQVTVTPSAAGTAISATWTDPASGLRVSVVATAYGEFPATEWVVSFENTGDQETGILSDIQAWDTVLRTGYGRTPTVLHELQGDACGESSFAPERTLVEPGQRVVRAPTGGRSSSVSAFPFVTVEYGGKGFIAAIGWTGQWALQVDRTATGPTRIRAGQEQTHLKLLPGERIRTPRIVLLAWDGDRTMAHNAFRRLLLKHYVPQADGGPVRMPIALQTFDRYNRLPEWACEAGQVQAVDMAHQLGCDTYWLDAAWFPGDFPNGVGNWFCKPEAFPRGLKPVSDRCHEYGMRFVLWFEPERVAPGSQIAEEHPEFVFGGGNGGLFKLNDPAARRWLTELLSERISEYGVDVYRNDFNMDPLAYWRGNDAPDRQGMTEIRYIEGLYAMWDELLARHPGLLIDNCSSGGRRIDVEMCTRSVPLWRSDTNCFAGNYSWREMQSSTLSLYVPLHTACTWAPVPNDVRSAGTTGLLCQFDYLAPGFPIEEAQRLVAETAANCAYWYGDFYPLTPADTRPDSLMAYQFHRPDLDAGTVLAFRRPDCPIAGLILELKALDPDGIYTVERSEGDGTLTTETVAGKVLGTRFDLYLPQKGSSLLVRYRRR